MRTKLSKLALLFFLLATAIVAAQDDEGFGPAGEETEVAGPFAGYVDDTLEVMDPEFSTNLGRWPTFASYVKAGPSFSLGDGFFRDDGRVGFAMTVGVRESLFANSGPWFMDFGGSYMNNGGRDAETVIAGQAFDTRNRTNPIPIGNRPNALTSTLRELRRASLNLAIGYYYQPIKSGCGESLLFSFRFGGRIGHVKGDFDRVPTEDFQDDIDQAIEDSQDDANPLDIEEINIVGTKPFADNDEYGGLFAGIETTLARQDFFGGDLTFVIDAELGNDWINLQRLKKAGLPTATVLMGLTVRR